MITGVIQHQKETLMVELPCKLVDLWDYLGSIGIVAQAWELSVCGTEQIKVQSTMENYACACRAAEDEEYDSPEDVWDRWKEPGGNFHLNL